MIFKTTPTSDYYNFLQARIRLEAFEDKDCPWHHPDLVKSEREDVDKVIKNLINDVSTLMGFRHINLFPIRSKRHPGRLLSLSSMSHLLRFTDESLFKTVNMIFEKNIPCHITHDLQPIVLDSTHTIWVDMTDIKRKFQSVNDVGDLKSILDRCAFSKSERVHFINYIQGAPLPGLDNLQLKKYIHALISLCRTKNDERVKLFECLWWAEKHLNYEQWDQFFNTTQLKMYPFSITTFQENQLQEECRKLPLYCAAYKHFFNNRRIREKIEDFLLKFLMEATPEYELKLVRCGGAEVLKRLNIPSFLIRCVTSSNPAIVQTATEKGRVRTIRTLDLRPFNNKCTPEFLRALRPFVPEARILYISTLADLKACLPEIVEFEKLEVLFFENLVDRNDMEPHEIDFDLLRKLKNLKALFLDRSYCKFLDSKNYMLQRGNIEFNNENDPRERKLRLEFISLNTNTFIDQTPLITYLSYNTKVKRISFLDGELKAHPTTLKRIQSFPISPVFNKEDYKIIRDQYLKIGKRFQYDFMAVAAKRAKGMR
jgi:hypothetical protein